MTYLQLARKYLTAPEAKRYEENMILADKSHLFSEEFENVGYGIAGFLNYSPVIFPWKRSIEGYGYWEPIYQRVRRITRSA